MPSRFLAASLVAAVVFAVALDAQAQQQSKAARRSRQTRAAAGAREPTAAADGTATATQGTAAPGDPFEAAAGRSEKTEGKAGESAGKADSPGEKTEMSKGKTETATFGAGCFWHVESAFEWLPGVKSAISGYSGGSVPHPSYEEVHEGVTGHAEVVQVEYDPSVITYEQLLKVFWTHHDPTQLNRQGPDVGPQYRSVIFYHNEAQRRAALKSYRELTAARAFPGPIVTQLAPMRAFYRAEDYHQNYYGGKDGMRATSRPHRTRKPAVKSKTAAAAGQPASKAATASAKRPADGAGAPPTSNPASGGETEP
jgi:peptide-methionine (S)-S-oxide reductase